MTTSAKTITIGGVSSTSKVDAMGKTENGKTGKSEIAQNLPGSPTTAARRRVTLRDVATAAGVSLNRWNWLWIWAMPGCWRSLLTSPK